MSGLYCKKLRGEKATPWEQILVSVAILDGGELPSDGFQPAALERMRELEEFLKAQPKLWARELALEIFANVKNVG